MAARYRDEGEAVRSNQLHLRREGRVRVTAYGVRKTATSLLFRFDFKLGRTRAIATERSVALVVFPLVSFMVDKVCSLQAHGVCAAVRNSGNTGVSKT